MKSAQLILVFSALVFLFSSNVSFAQCNVQPPTSISGSQCNSNNSGMSLGAVGGSLGTNGMYQWGTGTVAGSNIIASGQSTLYVNPNQETTYWVRIVNSTCGITTAAQFKTIGIASTAPSNIQWIAPVCPGSVVTLNALGGSTGSNGKFQWGTGLVGTNIIAGATTSSINVTQTTTTTYWARRVDGAPCNSTTGAVTLTVEASTLSTAPTTLTNDKALPLCANGGGTTLIANGGINGSQGRYQWGTGDVIGVNPIDVTWGNTKYVSPTTTTTYWVRRFDDSPCNNYTSGVKLTVTYAAPSITPTSIAGSNTTCKGSNLVLTAIGGNLGFAGSYQWGTGTTVGNNIINGQTGVSITVNPTTNTTYWVRTVDAGACYQNWIGGVTKTITVTSSGSTAPTTITGAPASICGGTNFTLKASGGTGASGSSFQWGTGTVGQNILNGTSQSITVSANTTTTYWVRRYDPSCGTYTAAKTVSVTVTPGTIAGALPPSISICKNTLPNNITLSGNVGNVIRWESSNNNNFTGLTQIFNSTSTTLTGAIMGIATTTKYYRALVQNGNCTTAYTEPMGIIVPPTVVYSGSWNGELTNASSIKVIQDLTLSSDFSVCSCEVLGNAKLTIAEGTTLTVQGSIDINPSAQLIVENNASLVQVDDAATNSGNVKVYRNSTPMKLFDYTYWSAPVQNQTLVQLSPNTLSDKYMNYNPVINNWAIVSGSSSMIPGIGYIVRAPQGWSLTNETNGIFNGIFSGTPNNGIIPVAIKKGAGSLNLIGNPYPSAVDIDLFLSNPTNANLLKGTIYLWTHNTAIAPVEGVVGSQYSAADYAKYNLTGSVRTSTAALSGEDIRPTGKIASGQAFFIETKDGLTAGSYQALFNNSMRVANNNDQFFKNSSVNDKHRIWLNLTNANGAYNEMLLGYVSGATNELDAAYDGKTFAAGNAVSLYSILDNEQLSIQGRALPFQASDVIPVGYTVGTAGTFSIAIDKSEGIFINQKIYLFDKQNNTTHDLKLGAYSFITAVGSFNDRFEIRFITNLLSTNDYNVSDFKIAIQHNMISINSGVTPMSDIAVYDLRGRLLFSSKASTTHFSTPTLNLSAEVLIVSVVFENGTTQSRKIIVQ